MKALLKRISKNSILINDIQVNRFQRTVTYSFSKIMNINTLCLKNETVKVKNINEKNILLVTIKKTFSNKNSTGINNTSKQHSKIIEVNNFFRTDNKINSANSNNSLLDNFISPNFINKQAFAMNSTDQNCVELKKIIIQKIQKSGPLTISEYMNTCLFHPQYGYYSTKEHIFGDKGDFVTAPEISQIFGEMISVFIFKQLEIFSFPKNYELLEIGPGRGYLAVDILRSLLFLGKLNGLIYSMVDKSQKLRELQQEMLFNFLVKQKFNVEVKNIMPGEHTFINVRSYVNL